ncbi:hypothetical protein [Clostridium felsineum]|uniref:Uncharacterized protein n=1 Tax=Clostridium felsineum TaxID=36839 RepID=A0A1S8LRI4_9CLOT|nr:hypothetical protein [Clostridium felsineum]URZ05877.1 hypothetical protein CLROS_012090 [Clostridium felsineum]URZ10914.1 hypothetical protein CROST_016300 [Clostridium felsineum]
MKEGRIDYFVKDINCTNEIIEKNIKDLEVILKESPDRYKKCIENFIINSYLNLYERKSITEKINSMQIDFNKIVGIIAKLKLLDYKYRTAYRMFKASIKEWIN